MASDRRRSDRERRGTARVPLTAAVRERGTTRLAQAQDIGPNGLSLVRHADEPSDAPVDLEFQLPDDERAIEVTAQVVFEKTESGLRRAGVKFLAIKDEDADRIRAYLSRRR